MVTINRDNFQMKLFTTPKTKIVFIQNPPPIEKCKPILASRFLNKIKGAARQKISLAFPSHPLI